MKPKICFATILMSLMLVVLVLAQLMLIAIPVSASGDKGTVTESTAPLLADQFTFFKPDVNDENLLTSTQTFTADAYEKSSALTKKFYAPSSPTVYSDTTAYMTLKIQNAADNVVSVGTLLFFTTDNGVCAAMNMLPLVYNANGEKMSVKTSYEYKTSARFLSGNSLPTFEIPANTTVYLVIPFTSVNDSTQYIAGMDMATEVYNHGTPPTQGALRSNKAASTDALKSYIETNGNSGLSQMQFCVGGNGVDSEGARDYTGAYNVVISEMYAVSKEDYNAKFNAANFKMDQGAAVRLNAQTGLRFTSTVSNTYYNYLVARYGESNVSYGTIITPTHYATAAGAMTFDALDKLDTATYGEIKYLNVKASGFYQSDATLSRIAGSIVGFKESHHDWSYSAVSYIKIEKNSEIIYLYAANVQTGIISDIAQKAVNDRKTEADDRYYNEISDDNANGKWSPYTTDQIDLLKSFYTN